MRIAPNVMAAGIDYLGNAVEIAAPNLPSTLRYGLSFAISTARAMFLSATSEQLQGSRELKPVGNTSACISRNRHSADDARKEAPREIRTETLKPILVAF